MKISIEKLQQKATERPPGYFEEVVAAGTVKDGWLYLDSTAYLRLAQKYSPSTVPPIPHSALRAPRLKGLGDAIALVAKPVARAIDRIAGTKLENCKPCEKRRAKLNAFFPFNS